MKAWQVLGFVAVAGLVAACSPPAGVNSAPQSAEDANREVAQAAARMQPGLWRTTITVQEVSMPGMPAELVRQFTSQPITVEECRTSDDPQEATAAWADAEEGCEGGTFRLTGNRFEGTQTCTDEGATMTMTFSGTLTPTRMEGETRMSGATPMGEMTQRATVVSERIGACAP